MRSSFPLYMLNSFWKARGVGFHVEDLVIKYVFLVAVYTFLDFWGFDGVFRWLIGLCMGRFIVWVGRPTIVKLIKFLGFSESF